MRSTNRFVYWGIQFSSKSHQDCFKLSKLGFILSLLLIIASFILNLILPENLKSLSSLITICALPIGPLFVHFGIALMAINETKMETINGEIWSKDCIWFNFLMAAIYIGMGYLWINYYF